MNFTKIKSNCWQNWFVLETLRGESLSLPFELLETACFPHCCPFLHFQGVQLESWLLSPHGLIFFSQILVLLQFIRTFGIIFMTHLSNPGEFPYLKIFNLITTVESFLPYKVTFTG